MSPLDATVLIIGGFFAGVANAFAGGGSFITFPLLMAAGLPPQVANATNRIAIVLQCASGTATYHRHGVMPWSSLPKVLPPMVLGAIPGAMLASHLDEDLFRRVSAVLLALMIVTLFLDPKKWTREAPEGGRIQLWHWPIIALLGFYGGFLQVGIGTFVLGFFVLGAGFDVVRGNALKFALAAIYNAAALAYFAYSGQVNWTAGLILAIGNVAGGILGAHWVVGHGLRWVRYVVLISALGAVAKLLFSGGSG